MVRFRVMFNAWYIPDHPVNIWHYLYNVPLMIHSLANVSMYNVWTLKELHFVDERMPTGAEWDETINEENWAISHNENIISQVFSFRNIVENWRGTILTAYHRPIPEPIKSPHTQTWCFCCLNNSSSWNFLNESKCYIHLTEITIFCQLMAVEIWLISLRF